MFKKNGPSIFASREEIMLALTALVVPVATLSAMLGV